MNAREITLNILNEIYNEQAYANIALTKCFNRTQIDELDRRFITEIVYGTVKAGDSLIWILKKFIKMPMNKIEPVVLNILRMGVYQIIFMDKVPNSAACNEAVNLVKKFAKKNKQGSSKFVNGVLRNVIRNLDKCTFPTGNKASELAIREQHPLWLVKKFIHTFGSEAAIKLCEFNNTQAPLVLRTNTLKTNRDDLMAKLTKLGCICQKSKLAPEGIIVTKHPSLSNFAPLQEGLAQVQDESSMLVAHVLNPKAGEFIIDTCSAPGGKTTHIASLMQNQGTIIAGDIYEHKLNLIAENATRLNINIIKTELMDAQKVGEIYPAKADKILVDAPCSGMGVLRRKVDSRWHKSEKLLEELPQLQLAILNSAAKALKAGGTLVYSTCSIMPEENVQVVEQFLQTHSEFILDDVHKYLGFKHRDKQTKMLQLMPYKDNTDGFFIARMIKQA